MDPSKKYVIVELNDGHKVEGVLTDVDKTNFTIHITEATKYKADEKGVNVNVPLTSPELKIAKGDIKEVKLVQYDQLKVTDPMQKTAQQMKPMNQQQFGALPTQQKGPEAKTKYKKDDFFDELRPMNNQENVRESMKDNEKNRDTFNLPEREYNNNNSGNYQGNRGGYQKRGRGGGRGRGGYNNNNNYNNNSNFNTNNYNNRNNDTFGGGNNFNNNSGGGYNNNRGGGYVNRNNNNNFNNNRPNFNNQNNDGGNNSYFNVQRGNKFGNDTRGGGGFNNNSSNYRGRGGNNRGRGRGNRNFNNNTNFNTFQDDNEDKCEERGKSIYDF